MSGIQAGNFMVLADKIDFSRDSTVSDVGGAKGNLVAVLASRHPHFSGVTYDLPPGQPIAADFPASVGVDRFESVAGDFFVDDLPKADVVEMGNMLHDWDEGTKELLVGKA